jgi:preprotein translocase subunit SecB
MKTASFKLKSFKVSKVSFNSEPGNEDLGFDLVPTGKFYTQTKEYVLTIDFTIFDFETKQKVLKCKLIGNFDIFLEEGNNNIPEYFYANSIAILFPYLRSFISTMTLQSNSGIIMVPTYNVSEFKEVLKKETEILD